MIPAESLDNLLVTALSTELELTRLRPIVAERDFLMSDRHCEKQRSVLDGQKLGKYMMRREIASKKISL